jgi:RNA polymerase sigma-70 factor (ECF subfamily)
LEWPTPSASEIAWSATAACYFARLVELDRNASDAQLVRAIAASENGAREAEAELCRRFAPRIRLYGLRHLRDEDLARDLVQAVLLGVLEAARAGRVKDPERIDRFMLGACRNQATRARETGLRAQPLQAQHETAAPEIEHLDLGGLMLCLAKLDERARQVVLLSFNEERSAVEVAARLQTTAGNARVLRHRAVAALRRCLDASAEASS